MRLKIKKIITLLVLMISGAPHLIASAQSTFLFALDQFWAAGSVTIVDANGKRTVIAPPYKQTITMAVPASVSWTNGGGNTIVIDGASSYYCLCNFFSDLYWCSTGLCQESGLSSSRKKAH
ncbi:hypothetical protein Bealeia1_01877 [Candidatus Bealeia paramacronuclearis]|uniref:Uncharacterized protein n=1 Tax=Candidatus Bealeia paramacronuclearis TaxID=1921001 RepID=A0ABZ2C6E6_9PROT|nr:hypothetical protein [Candidatus Bealeia paramacronuclearis]